MAKCTYIYNGHTFDSEMELDDFLLEGKDKLYSKYGDIVFEKEEKAITLKLLGIITEQVKDLQDRYKFAKEHPKYLDGEEELLFDFPYIGVTSFLKGLTNSDDLLLTPEFREIEYWKKRVKAWKDPSQGFNEDEEELFGKFSVITDPITNAQLEKFIKDFDKDDTIIPDNQNLKLIVEMKKKWKALGEMGTAIHDVLRHLFTAYSPSAKKAGMLRVDDSTELLMSLYFGKGKHYNTKYLTELHVRDIIEYAKQLKKSLILTLGDNDLTFFPEFQISTKLNEEIPGKGDTVLGIIDLLVVDSQGNARVIDYKCSPKDSFNSAKERGFWYLLGLYNRMLQANSIKTTTLGYSVMVAPIKMKGFRKENDKFIFDGIEQRDRDIIMDITVHSTLHEVKRNLDEFVPKRKEVDVTPKDVIANMTKFNASAFPDINTSKTWGDSDIKNLIENNGGISYDPKTKKYSIKINNGKSFSGESEPEVFDLIKKYYTETLPTKRKDMATHVLIALRKGIKENTTNIDLPLIGLKNSKEGASAEWFRNTVSKYCNKNHEIIENAVLLEFGVILIKNKITQLINVLKITTDNLDFKQHFGTNRTLITGNFETDRVQMRKPKSLAIESDNGNIHLMETMALLNCIPGLLDNAIIGEVLVANPHDLLGRSASNEELQYNFKELVSHIDDYHYNLKNVKFADMVDLARYKFNEIMEVGGSNDWRDDNYRYFKSFVSIRTGLDSAISDSDERRILRELEELRKKLEQNFKIQISLELNSYDETLNPARALYNRVVLAIAETKGISFRQQTRDNNKFLESIEIHRNGVLSLMLDNPGNLNNETLNNLTKLVSEAYQNVREDMQREMILIRELVSNLKQTKGFNKMVEMTGGNSATLFKNMIKYTDDDILFVNPWVDFRGSEAERKFLEHALVKINQNRFLNMSDEQIEEMRISGDPKYYRVPLAIGDTASQAAVLGGLSKTLKKRLKRLQPKVWWEETLQKLLGVFKDVHSTSDDEKVYEMSNMFDGGENATNRKELILEKGIDYFESNLETLLIKHLYAYSSKKHIDTIMPLAKASMIHLITLGHLTNKKYENATNYVTDYIKNKIKNESLIPPNLREADAIIGQLKYAASFLVLGFSPIQYGYLMIQGLWTDIRLMFQGLGQEDTPFTFENFKFAFGQLYRDFFKLGSKPTKCSLLNEYFGMNDMDMNTYAEKIKSDRYGIFNAANIAFHCTSRPDFFNRMAIFIALMKLDGVWDAYSEENGVLVYNWKKDKRFDIYALGEEGKLKDAKKYKEQEGLYFAIAELLVKEHALNKKGTQFKVGDPLPKAYTNLQIESYKSVADDIYGYYTHEKKAMINATTIGALWMQMRNFWSGKKNQYLGGPGIKLKGKFVHKQEPEGTFWYYKEENGKLIPTTEITGVPIMLWEGLWQEGILLTMYNLVTESFENGFKTTFDDFWNNPEYAAQKANVIQLAYDMIMFTTVGPILVGMMQDWDDELTNEAKDVDEAAVAAAAHMAMKMVSTSFGDFNFVESIGMPLVSWQPFSFSYLSRRYEDIVDVAMGDKNFLNALLNMSSVTSNTKVFWRSLFNG